MTEDPGFNLWTEPWITLETGNGHLEAASLETTLLRAGHYRGIYEPSPLTVVAVHRLLVAILQDTYRPQQQADLVALWRQKAFDADRIRAFGREYGHRFDLFDAEVPFLQSADIPRDPEKKGRGKSVGYLLPEITAGTAVTHYTHIYEDDLMLCAACCGRGLVQIPAFASSGGAGIKPSINGVPPMYVLPGGDTLYRSLVASLVRPRYQPRAADTESDTPWWRHDPVVGKKQEVVRVGYLHSLTFPARRIRLHPEPMTRPCSRCGQQTTWGAAEMVYEMGQSRPDDAAYWEDPFAAYRLRGEDGPVPVRPVDGRSVWREFGYLFLQPAAGVGPNAVRPAVVNQIEDILAELDPDGTDVFPFVAVGLRTDMKMKIFEWQTSGFLVTPQVLNDPDSGEKITAGLDFAVECDRILKRMYQSYFSGGPSAQFPAALPIKGPEAVRQQMTRHYWQELGDEFSRWVIRFTPGHAVEPLYDEWLQTVVHTGAAVFRRIAGQLNSGNSTALICEQAVSHCVNSLNSYRHKVKPREVIQ